MGIVLLPRADPAQASAKTRRVGLLMSTTPTAAAHIVTAFAEGLGELGHVVGKDVVVEYRWAEGHVGALRRAGGRARAPEDGRARGLLAGGRDRAGASHEDDPDRDGQRIGSRSAGLVASLARPGGNVTGLSQQLTPEIRAKQLQLIKEVLPKTSQVAVLWSSSTTVGLREYETAAQPMGIKTRFVELPGADDLGRVFAAMAADRVDALPRAGRYAALHRAAPRRRAGPGASAAGHVLVERIHAGGRPDVLLGAAHRAVPARGRLRRQDSSRRCLQPHCRWSRRASTSWSST